MNVYYGSTIPAFRRHVNMTDPKGFNWNPQFKARPVPSWQTCLKNGIAHKHVNPNEVAIRRVLWNIYENSPLNI
jgi:hypothetical protein